MKKLVGALLNYTITLALWFFRVSRTLFQRHPILFKYGLGIGLVAFMVWTNRKGLADVKERHLDLALLALAFALTAFGLVLTFLRWYILVRAVGLPFTMTNACRLGLIGYAFSTLLPGSVGGDIIKAAFIAREQRRRTVAVATVLLDRAIGLWALCWFVAILGSVFWIRGDLPEATKHYLQSIIVIAVGLSSIGVLLWVRLGWLPEWRADRFADRLERKIPRFGRQAAECWRTVWMYRKEGKTFWIALVIGIVGHFGFVFLFYLSALSIQTDPAAIPTVVEHVLIVPIGMLVQAIVPTPGGLGFGELTFGGLYEMLGKAKTEGLLGSLMQRAVSWVLAFFGYLVYLRMRPALSAAALPEETESVIIPDEMPSPEPVSPA